MIDESTVKEIQQRIKKAQLSVTKAELETEHALEVVKELKNKLQDDFQVSTGKEIKDKLAALKKERDELLAKVESELDKAGA